MPVLHAAPKTEEAESRRLSWPPALSRPSIQSPTRIHRAQQQCRRFNFNNGKLVRIPNSLRFLSGNAVASGSVAFSPDGQFLIVTEKANLCRTAHPQDPGSPAHIQIVLSGSARPFDRILRQNPRGGIAR